MSNWVMKCSVCDRQFEVDRDVVPVNEAAPQHDQVLGEVTYERSPCLGSGEVLLRVKP